MDEKLIVALISSTLTFVGAFSLTVVARWREDERSRSEQRYIVSVLKSEIGQRNAILCNRFADLDLSSDVELGDIMKKMNYGKSGPTFNYSEELRAYAAAFGSLRDKIAFMQSDTALAIWKHYTNMDELLLAHNNLLGPGGRDEDEAAKILADLRRDVSKLFDRLADEYGHRQPRLFVAWFLLWLVGRA